MKIAILGPLPSQLSALRRAFPDDEVIGIRKADNLTAPDADLFVAWVRFIGHPMEARLRSIAGDRPFLRATCGGVSGVVRAINNQRRK